MSNRFSCFLVISCLIYLADGWFLGMLGCQNRCSTYAGYYQNRSPQHLPPPPPPQYLNSYATPPAMYIPPPVSYPVAPQMAFPMSSYAMPQYAVVPQHSYILPPPYPTPPPYVRPPPVYVTQPPVYVTPKPYVTPPPPKCFQNTDGFKCCNKELDKFLDMKVVEMLKPEWQRCNMQRLATQLQNQAQAMFNHSMESIVASGNMENLSNYRGDLYCKKKSQDGKIVLIYGTIVPYSLNPEETRPMNETELKERNYPAIYSDLNLHNGNERLIQSRI